MQIWQEIREGTISQHSSLLLKVMVLLADLIYQETWVPSKNQTNNSLRLAENQTLQRVRLQLLGHKTIIKMMMTFLMMALNRRESQSTRMRMPLLLMIRMFSHKLMMLIKQYRIKTVPSRRDPQIKNYSHLRLIITIHS